MEIAKVETLRIRMPEPGEPGVPERPREPDFQSKTRIVQPYSIFEDHEKARRLSRKIVGYGPHFVVVRITTDDGLVGYGTPGTGRAVAAFLVENILAPVIVGESPFDTELLWERMYRGMIKYGRRGVGISAISAIDLALWDIIGKACNQPVCNLLGGRFRSRVRAYASSLYPYARLEDLAEEARIHLENGFDIMKMRISNGPMEGLKGMQEDLAKVRTVRQVIGDNVELAIECAQGWNVEHALVMLKHLEPYNIKWIEEPVLADNIEGYRRIREAANARGILVSGGEHHFTRFEHWRLIKEKAVDILQPDVERVGGITEAKKIWSMAQPEEIQVIPHQGYLHNLHLIVSHFNSPLVEHHVPQWDPEGKSDVHRIVFDGEPVPERGYVSVPETPGLGRTLSAWAQANTVNE